MSDDENDDALITFVSLRFYFIKYLFIYLILFFYYFYKITKQRRKK